MRRSTDKRDLHMAQSREVLDCLANTVFVIDANRLDQLLRRAMRIAY